MFFVSFLIFISNSLPHPSTTAIWNYTTTPWRDCLLLYLTSCKGLNYPGLRLSDCCFAVSFQSKWDRYWIVLAFWLIFSNKTSLLQGFPHLPPTLSLTVSDFDPEHPFPDLEGTVWGQRRKLRWAFNISCWISRDRPLNLSSVWSLSLGLRGKHCSSS